MKHKTHGTQQPRHINAIVEEASTTQRSDSLVQPINQCLLKKAATQAGMLLLLAMLVGCAHRQFVDEPYPRWGDEKIIQSPDGNAPLILRTLYPPEPANARACVLLVHGMNEYIGRYADVARHFANQYIVTGFDFYAHGLSNPILRQADRALLAGAGRQNVSDAFLMQSILRDLEPMRRTLDRALRQTISLCDRQGDSKRPVLIVSHSLGALITASYLLQMQHETDLAKRIQGVVFLGPAFAVSEPPGWRGWLTIPVIKFSFHVKTHFLRPHDEPLPLLLFNQLLSLAAVPIIDGIFEIFSWPGLRHFLTPVTPDWVVDYLTDSNVEKTRLRADGWIIRRSLLRYVKGIETEIVYFRRQMNEFAVPYYLIYSEYDPITPAWGSRDFAHATLHRNPDNEVFALPNLPYHQHLFLNEPIRSELLQRIKRWMEHRVLN